MSTTTLGDALLGLGQAGRPTMQSVRWHSQHFTENLMSVPRPSLVFSDQLYISWGHTPLMLTPLLVYGDGLTYATKRQSGGNSFLMFAGEQGWIPVAEHIRQSAPGLMVRLSHIYDYAMLWRRAETAVQVHFSLPRRCAHDDPRLGDCWRTGEDLLSTPLNRDQRRKISQAKSHWKDRAGSSEVGGEFLSLWSNAGEAEASSHDTTTSQNPLGDVDFSPPAERMGQGDDPLVAGDGTNCLVTVTRRPATPADLQESTKEPGSLGTHQRKEEAIPGIFDQEPPSTSASYDDREPAVTLDSESMASTRQHASSPTEEFEFTAEHPISPGVELEPSSSEQHSFCARLEVMWTVNSAGCCRAVTSQGRQSGPDRPTLKPKQIF